LAGYADRMDTFFQSNPGFRSRIAHHIDFPDYQPDELLKISQSMLSDQGYQFDDEAQALMSKYIDLRIQQPYFANARSIRNALDRMRLRQANRLFERTEGDINAEQINTIIAEDIAPSRVFAMGVPNNDRAA